MENEKTPRRWYNCERLGNHLRANIEPWKNLPEGILGIDLGQISLKPWSEFLDDYIFILGVSDPLYQASLKKYFSRHCNQHLFPAAVIERTIYYSQSPIVYLQREKTLSSLGLHELGHLCHFQELRNRGFHNPSISLTPAGKTITEGLADYLMIAFTKNFGIKNPFISYRQEYNQICLWLKSRGSLENISESFQCLVDKSEEYLV